MSDLEQRQSAILAQRAPQLPKAELLAFVQSFFDRRQDLLSLVRHHQPPFYLLEKAVLRQRARRLQSAFEKVLSPMGFYFAVKSNNHPEVAKTLLAAGFGLDVSSGLELQMALKLGAEDIVFSGPGKTMQELALAVEHAERVVVLLDSFGELQRLEAAAAAGKAAVRCGVRLTTTGDGLWRKFGIGLDDLYDFWQAAGQCRHIALSGVQFHTSWNMSAEPQTAFIRKLGRTLAGLPPLFQRRLEFIDIGGGYWPGQGEWLHPRATPRGRLLQALGQPADSPGTHYRLAAESIEAFAERLAAAIKTSIFPVARTRVCVEPGRWICNDAMHLFLSVVDKKAPDLVITDAGTNAVGWERFESDYFPILNLTRPALEEKPCLILGSLCTPHDLWGYMYFGQSIENGDILMIPTQGAYTYSLRQAFIKPLPEVVVLQGHGGAPAGVMIGDPAADTGIGSPQG